MSTLICTVPVPPSLNNAYATIGKRRVLSKEGRAFKDAAAIIVRLEAIRQKWKGDKRFSLHLTLRFKNRQRRDISNCIKLIEDVLSEVLDFDDCMIDEITVRRGEIDKEDPRCIVILRGNT
jgi:crossover junction endodeoxyribonuclease RusA